MSKIYTTLLSSIINLSHRVSSSLDQSIVTKDGESAMLSYNDVLAIIELKDLVTFLEIKYLLVGPLHST